MVTLIHMIGQLGRGGAEKQLFCLVAALQKRGWQQAIVSFSPGGVWQARFDEIGVPVHHIPQSRFKVWRLWKLQRLVRREKPRLLMSWSAHVASYGNRIFGGPALVRVFNVRFDLTVDTHSGLIERNLGRLRRTLERSDFVVSNSRRNLDGLRGIGIRLPESEVIYNIVAARREGPSCSPRPARIVAVGSLIPRKAIDVLLQAAAVLAADGRKFEIALAGVGPEQSNLEALADKLNIRKRVTFLGDVTDIPALLATAQILAHPARAEGLSNAILEAMAEGVPVVACPVGATSELISDGQNGLLVPVDEPRPLAAALSRLLDDSELRIRLGRNAWEHVSRHFGEATIAGQYEKVFHRLIDADA
jgi:glycosyltransferase involved in cell wall biosynthesis